MSFYWQWVVVRTAVAAAGGIVQSAADHFSALKWGASTATTPSVLSWMFVAITLVLAEVSVLRRWLPRLSKRFYVLLATAPSLMIGAILLAALWDSPDTFGMPSLGDSAVEESYSPLELAAFAGAIAIILSPLALLPWLALRRAASGLAAWALFVVLGLIGYSLVLILAPELVSNGASMPEYATWTGTAVEFLTGQSAEVLYALISGIGVARLRPLPEATP